MYNQEIKKLITGIATETDSLKEWENHLESGGIIQELAGISEEDMEMKYREGHRQYQEGDYSKAKEHFSYLALMNPHRKEYWLGLATSQMKLNDNENALVSYACASYLDADDPNPHFCAAACYLKQDNKEDALRSLKIAQEIVVKSSEYSELNAQIEILIKQIT